VWAEATTLLTWRDWMEEVEEEMAAEGEYNRVRCIA
jgi:hypothetical protein